MPGKERTHTVPDAILYDYFYGDEAEQFIYFRIPRQLITSPRFKQVSTDAKLLYGMLLDRMGLSAKNEWYDTDGRVYIYYTVGSLILSIQNSGVMEPVILRKRDDGEYQLLSGYRRVAASERAGKKDIPAFVYEMTMQEAIAYRKAVKNDPKTPIPGKLAAAEVEGKDKEKPADPEKAAPPKKDDKVKSSFGISTAIRIC